MYDVIVIGSGAAGLTTALESKKQGYEVLVISKDYPTFSQSCQAQGGINALLDEFNDSIDEFVEDTFKASRQIANKKQIRKIAKLSKDSINWLSSLGVPFTKDLNNNIAQRRFGGTTKRRTCYSSDYTGLKIINTLYDNCIKEDIKFLNEEFLLDIAVENGVANAVITLNINKMKISKYESSNIVLATGGYSNIFCENTTNSFLTTADGLAIAYKNNAKLSNMEFVQFHPTALKDTNILISESARAEGGYLLDKNYNRFIDELKTRDEIARQVYKKVLKKENVYLDLRHLGKEKISKQLPQERTLALSFANTDIIKEPLSITVAAHYTMGGILVDENMKTSIENLYAIGECAQASLHGANRLGGNSLLEVIAFSREVVNVFKKEFIKSNVDIQKYKKSLDLLLHKEVKIDFYEVKEELSKILFEKAGVIKTNNSLKQALDYILVQKNNLQYMGIKDKSTYYNRNLVDFLEFKNILLISELFVRSAISRDESRGSHYKEDYAFEDENFKKESIIQKGYNGPFICFKAFL
ncbi:FAD-dependent oxidoreductase [Arcobacter sp. CECT 8985]|uniref:FAD-dependent oxidoreductase n=1 Tax=Arcobacter sp. CECT 8985 TaxID=1935424 RepID=UPI00100B3F9D|nr:FAD-dependent oxidoreductase [Arcobacter sp. CECT 8985]RXJ86882.1 succinate dehydrogenase [Arcobacter sp. CECT 8985]